MTERMTQDDQEATGMLVRGGLVVGALLASEVAPERLRWMRWIALGVGAGMTAKALSRLASGTGRMQPAGPESISGSPRYPEPSEQRGKHASGYGVPHRIPVEISQGRDRWDNDPDDKPAPSVDGDLGIAD